MKTYTSPDNKVISIVRLTANDRLEDTDIAEARLSLMNAKSNYASYPCDYNKQQLEKAEMNYKHLSKESKH